MKKSILTALILSLFVVFSCSEPEVINGKDGINGIDGKNGEKGEKGDKGDKGDSGTNNNETEKKLIGVWNIVRMYSEINGKKTEIDINNVPKKGYFTKITRIKYDGKVSTRTTITYKDGKKIGEEKDSHFYRVVKNIITSRLKESHFFIEKDLLHIANPFIENVNSEIKYEYTVLEKQK